MSRTTAVVIGLCVSAAFAPQASASITINFFRPTDGGISGDDLSIAVGVMSTEYEIVSVSAKLGNATGELVFDDCATSSTLGNCGAGWVGQASIAGLSRGTHELTIIATDALNHTATASIEFVHDNAPVIEVTAPLPYSVARLATGIKVQATCSDDDPAGCTSLNVSRGSHSLASGTDAVDEDVVLSVFLPAKTVALSVTGIDSVGSRRNKMLRPVYVLHSWILVDEDIAASEIMDFDDARILYRTSSGLVMLDRVTRAEQVIPQSAHTVRAFLTSRGAIFETGGDKVGEWRDGSILVYAPASDLVNCGDYAAWHEPYPSLSVFWLDIATRDLASLRASYTGELSVACNGDLVFAAETTTLGQSVHLYRYRAGTTTQLTAGGVIDSSPVTDGINVIWVRFIRSSGERSIMLLDSTGLHELTTPRDTYYTRYRDYTTRNGWAAFRQPSASGVLQVWLRDPSGTSAQATFWTDPSEIAELGSNGELIVNHGAYGRGELIVPGEEPVPIDLGDRACPVKETADGWKVAVGRELFSVDPTLPPPPDAGPGMGDGGGGGGCGCASGRGGGASTVLLVLLVLMSLRRRADRLFGRAVLAVVPAVAACGGESGGRADAGGPRADATVLPDAHHQYVIDTITLPASNVPLSECILDIDDDSVGIPEDGLGMLLTQIARLTRTDPQPTMDAALADGSALTLMDVQTSSLIADSSVTMRPFVGEDADVPADPGNNFSGSGRFNISADSPTGDTVVGGIASPIINLRPGTMSLRIVPFANTPVIAVPLVGVRLYGRLTETGIGEAVLGGAITPDTLNNIVLPAIVSGIQAIVAQDCSGTFPNCCADGSKGETVVSLFDDNGDCLVSESEITNHNMVQSRLTPDVDLFDASGNYNPRSDGVRDSLSFGACFTAVGAQFNLP